MSRCKRLALCGWILATIASTAAPAAAKSLCGTFGARFYVLEKVKTKVGSHGPVSGYFTTAGGGASAPFSGHYAVFTGVYVSVAISESVGQTGFGYGTVFHNFAAPLSEGSFSNAYSTEVNGESETVAGASATETAWVDCKTVPKFLGPS